ncbi:MAG: ATP cone domain-containing protein, partial [Patescibacteria group bacterium]
MTPTPAFPIKQVKKRDGRLVSFDKNRITRVIYRAMLATGEGNRERDPLRISDRVVKELLKKYPKGGIPHIEEIQDIVEEALILMDFPKTAKSYILYRNERAQVRDKTKTVPEHVGRLVRESKKHFRNALSEFIYYRTYSRWIEEENRRETWIETVGRYMSFMCENIGDKLKDEEYAEIREAILNQEVMPSMRLLWSAGWAAGKTNVSAYNCSFIAPSRLEDFAEIMYLSMCGTGVGFSVESQNIQLLPIIKKQLGEKLEIHIIEDSKEGWGNALTLGLKTWYSGKDIEFDYSLLRPAGARLITMGGRSSGPGPLRALLDFARGKILSKPGRRLSNIDVHDIICKIGEVVVMGGVRRSALISLSDLDDDEMRHAKTGQFYLTEPQRSMANNSAVYNEKPSATEFMEEWLALAKSGTGERGIFNRGGLESQLPRRRWKVFKDHYLTSGTNPCVTADTWVMTSTGAALVKDLLGAPFEAVIDGKIYKSSGFFETGEKEVFKIKTGRGHTLKVTGNHKILTVGYKTRKVQRNVWKEVKDLTPGDKIVLHNHCGFHWMGLGTEQEGWLLGSLIGDGNIEANGRANLDYWGEAQSQMMTYAADLIHATVGGRSDLRGHLAKSGDGRVGSTNLGTLAISYGIKYNQKFPTDLIEMTSSDFYRGFLKGWFDADGSVQGNQAKGVSVRLNSSYYGSLERAQRMLSRLGIMSTIYKNRKPREMKLMPDGRGGLKEYLCRSNHELVISGSNLEVFTELINFNDSAKKNKLELLLSSYKRK